MLRQAAHKYGGEPDPAVHVHINAAKQRLQCEACASPHLTSPHLTSPHITSTHLTSPQHTSPHLTSSHITSPHLTSCHLTHTKSNSHTLTHNHTQGDPSCIEGTPTPSLYIGCSYIGVYRDVSGYIGE